MNFFVIVNFCYPIGAQTHPPTLRPNRFTLNHNAAAQFILFHITKLLRLRSYFFTQNKKFTHKNSSSK